MLNYLNDNSFSQNLISRQDEIDSVLINYVNQEYDKQVRRDSEEVIQITSNLAIKDIVNSTETDNSIGVEEIQIEKNVNHWLTRVFKLANIRTFIKVRQSCFVLFYPFLAEYMNVLVEQS